MSAPENSDRDALSAVLSPLAEESVKRSSNRTFGLVFAAFFVLVAVLPLMRRHAVRIWALPLVALFLLAALAAPKLLTPLNRAWTALGALLHAVVNPLILGILFYVVFTPFGWVLRRMGKDFLRLRPAPGAPTYWIPREPPGPSPESMSRQF
ncbi:MAG: SxtJ family membrane protein [Bryobacteraceae bacterium]|jgi:small-conductance mechanosensitive channel